MDRSAPAKTAVVPRRCYFRFRLRTMFVLVTLAALACSWVAYSLNWIRQRHGILNEDRGMVWDSVSFSAPHSPPPLGSRRPPRAPGGLWLFGERGYAFVMVTRIHKDESERMDRLQRLFPEAEIAIFEK